MSSLDEPARKLFICQCLKSVLEESDDRSENCKWTLISQNKVFPLKLVWLQGIILNVSCSFRSFCLDDGSGIAYVNSANGAPGFGPWIKNGQYAMVIGELISVQPTIKVRALKLTRLTEPNAETLWILEVLDVWKFMDS